MVRAKNLLFDFRMHVFGAAVYSEKFFSPVRSGPGGKRAKIVKLISISIQRLVFTKSFCFAGE